MHIPDNVKEEEAISNHLLVARLLLIDEVSATRTESKFHKFHKNMRVA